MPDTPEKQWVLFVKETLNGFHLGKDDSKSRHCIQILYLLQNDFLNEICETVHTILSVYFPIINEIIYVRLLTYTKLT